MKALLSSFFLLFSISSFAQPRFTDSTFGTNGKIIENTSTSEFTIVDAAIQTDNKSVVLAEAYYNTYIRTVLIRYNTNGTLDASFSGNGIADDAIVANGDFQPQSIRLQPDGKILVCGSTDQSPTPSSGFVMRYNTDGTPDNTFGTGGISYLPSFTIGNTTTTVSNIYDIAVLSNGKIMLLSSNPSLIQELSLILLNTNGTVDNTFGTNGAIWYDIVTSNSYSYKKILAQPDGKIIVAGDPSIYQSSSTGYTGILLLRINADGSIDNTYGTNGKLLLDAGTAYKDALTDIAVRSDNKLIVSGVGSDYAGRYSYQYFLRIGTNGTVDNSFGTSGKQFVYFTTTNFASYEGQISLSASGQVLAAGYYYNNQGYYTMAALRLTADGALDNTFGTGGLAPVTVNQNSSYGMAPLQQSDGKVVVAGVVKNSNISAVSIGRLSSSGQIDNTINPLTAATTIGSGIDDERGVNVHVQPDQKLLSLSERFSGFTYDLCLRRCLPNGQPDATFGTNGKVFIDLPGLLYRELSGVMANGKITIAPVFSDYVQRSKIALVRVNADGSMDNSFGTGGKLFFKTKPNAYNPLLDAQFYADGKILLSVNQQEGNPLMGTNIDSTFIIRLDASGNYDATFGTGGKLYAGNTSNSTAEALCIQPDGKIIMVGSFDGGSGYQGSVKRLLPNGAVDNTFNNGNAIILSTTVSQVKLQPDGKMVIVKDDNTVARLNPNGTTDASFGNAGVANFSTYYSTASNEAISDIQADTTNLYLMGRHYDATTGERLPTVLRLKYSGTPDSAFGQNGVAAAGIHNSSSNYTNLRMAVQADKKVVITGFDEVSNGNADASYFALTRLKASNTPASGHTYTFTGSGNWSNPANWSGGMVPPSTITAGNSIIINTPGGQCVIDIPVTVQQGASFTVSAGSTLLLPGNLTIQ